MRADFTNCRPFGETLSRFLLPVMVLMGALWCLPVAAAPPRVLLPDGTLAEEGVLAESFGTDLGSNNGVHAYSNGSTTYISNQYLTTCGVSGMKWQCVEYSRRWLHSVSDLCFGSVSYAYQIWGSVTSATDGTGASIPFDNYGNGGSTPPQFGDLLIYNSSVGSGAGHVAVIVAVNLASGYIRVAEQNWSNSSWGGNDYARQLTLSTASGNYTVSGSGIYGWKRARVGNAPTSWLFNTAGNREGWTANNVESQIVADGYWTINPGSDPQLISPVLNRPPSLYDYMKLGMKNRGTDHNGQIFFSAPGLGYNEGRSAAFSNPNDGEFNWITVPVGRINNWGTAGTIQTIRIDPVRNGSGGSDDVLTDYIFIREDLHPPYQPTVDSVTPSTWTNGAITVAFHSNDPEDVNPVGPDVYGSGVASFQYRVDAQTDQTKLPSSFNDRTGEASATITYSKGSLASGTHTFHVYCWDNSGRVGTESITSLYYDGTAPTNPTSVTSGSHTTGVWSSDNTVSVSWSGASDAHSGISGYSWTWTTSTSTVPDNTQDGSGTTTTSSALPDESTWYFHVHARDNAGNWNTGAKHYGPFKIDTTAPSNPTSLSSTSHTTGECSTDPTIDVCWSGASDGSGSGIAGYAVAWSHNAGDVPSGTTSAVSCATSGTLGDGTWYVHVRAKDNVGLWASGAKHLGPFCIDRTAPGAVQGLHSTTHAVGEWTNAQSIGMAWSAASDGGAGIAGYSILWSHQSGDTPDGTVDVTGLTASTTLADGVWFFHIRAVDLVGNAGSTQNAGPFEIDHVAPTAIVDVPNGGEVWSLGGDGVVRWTATDATSGVDSVSVWLSTDGGVSFPMLLGKVPGDSDSLVWAVAGSPTDSAMVRISVSDLAGNMSTDTSDGVFGISSTTGVPAEGTLPASVALLGSVPNPLDRIGKIGFSVPVEASVSLRVYSIQGRLVRELADGSTVQPGFHWVAWDRTDDSGQRVANGVYLCRLEAAGQVATSRLIVLSH